MRASSDDNDLSSGLLMLICGDAIRPGLAWMLTRTHRYLALVMAETRDPPGSPGCASWPKPGRHHPWTTPVTRPPGSRR